tara:strand:+ start:23579 stop:24640 length:1062 start_codon:yes stop_codon:yes gene_type:complete
MIFYLLSALFVISGCSPDYGMYYNKVFVEENTEPEVIVVTETEYVPIVVPEYIEVEVIVEVEVEAEYGEIWVDSFTQLRSVDGVDIVWVIDTSGSMTSYSSQLLLGIETMLNALPTNQWRLAMVAADPYYAYQEAQFPLLPGDTITDAQNMYNNMLRGHHERGFDALYEFLVNNQYAQSWLRPDAALLVVFVSDEEEQSSQHFSNYTQFYNWYSIQRGGSVFAASINNYPDSVSLCSHYVNPTYVGYEYMDLVSLMGGQSVDICDSDWSAGVIDASNQVQPYESWPLTHTPHIEDSIRVFIDGQLNWDWYYNSSDNTIYFTTIPDGDALVEIGYLYLPAPVDTGDTGLADTGN